MTRRWERDLRAESFAEGVEAYERGFSADVNPYPADSVFANSFLWGWQTAEYEDEVKKQADVLSRE